VTSEVHGLFLYKYYTITEVLLNIQKLFEQAICIILEITGPTNLDRFLMSVALRLSMTAAIIKSLTKWLSVTSNPLPDFPFYPML